MNDGTGLAEALLGLDGFRVLEVSETPAEVVVEIETTADFMGCSTCGTRAEAHERMPVEIRDLACFGRPARLVWRKRRWRCSEADCEAKTWTERSEHVSSRALLTVRAGAEACRQVGENARPVSELAEELGVCWSTVMAAVTEHGTPLVEDPSRVGAVERLGVDETSWLKATASHPTLYATGLVDLDERILIDMIEGNSADDLREWCGEQDRTWLAGIGVVTNRPGRVLPGRARPSSRSCPTGGRSVPCGEGGEPMCGRRSSAGAERDHRPPRPQARPPLSDPQAVAHRHRAPPPTRP